MLVQAQGREIGSDSGPSDHVTEESVRTKQWKARVQQRGGWHPIDPVRGSQHVPSSTRQTH